MASPPYINRVYSILPGINAVSIKLLILLRREAKPAVYLIIILSSTRLPEAMVNGPVI